MMRNLENYLRKKLKSQVVSSQYFEGWSGRLRVSGEQTPEGRNIVKVVVEEEVRIGESELPQGEKPGLEVTGINMFDTFIWY